MKLERQNGTTPAFTISNQGTIIANITPKHVCMANFDFTLVQFGMFNKLMEKALAEVQKKEKLQPKQKHDPFPGFCKGCYQHPCKCRS